MVCGGISWDGQTDLIAHCQQYINEILNTLFRLYSGTVGDQSI